MAAKITVVGSFAVGMTIRSPVLPVFGQTLLGRDFDMGPGGKGSNQAVASARLGADSALVAYVGDDALARIGTDLYAAEGVDARHVRTLADRATGVGFIILNPEGNNFIILDMGANDALDPAAVEAAGERIAASDVVLAVLEIPTSAAARALELGRAAGARTILNPAPARLLPASIFAHVDVLVPNESELRVLLDLPADDPTPSRELAQRLRDRGVGTVIVTLGRDGALVLSDQHDLHIPSMEVRVVDTTGAGDAFCAGLAVALAEGKSIPDAARFAAVCGSHACTRLGVIPGAGSPGRDRQAGQGLSCEDPMKRSRILNAELSHAIASMGHGDLMIVCDAGFPIPRGAWRIDLAILPDLPDLATVLGVVAEDLIAEKVAYADTLPVHNAPLLATVKRLFPDADHGMIPHEAILGEMAAKAKAIVRTGAFDPWGNILLYSGVDVPKWFSKPGTVAPDYYAKKLGR
jgi:ribokinase